MHLLAVILSSLLLEYVNPFVGTDGHGHTFPGAVYPFGMVQLSPDTRPDDGDWDGCSGYHYSDNRIYGFSHTHLSGTGCDDLCDILMMPVVDYEGQVDRERYCSEFSHDDEHAHPGYYEVLLKKYDIRARLTVGRRTGMHEYSFPRWKSPQVIIDLRHRDVLDDGIVSLDIRDARVVTGHRRSTSWAHGQDVYFCIEFSEPVLSFSSDSHSAVLTFRQYYNNVITAKVAISSVSEENARANLRSENPKNFETLKKQTERAWERIMMRLPCPSEDPEKTRCYYTALYHCATHPSLYSDANGEYRGMDRKVHRAVTPEGVAFDRYTVFSLWDTFRGLHPLLTRFEPALTADFLRSFRSIYDECGKLPVWELWGYETNCMIGYNSAPVIADALAAGYVERGLISRTEAEALLNALVASSQLPQFGMDSFRRNGLVLADDEHESVSKTLEYAYDDWCVAQVAARLGRQDIHDRYMVSAQYWRNVLDPSTGFMRARLNGRFVTPFDPREVNNNYTEANSWQYSFFVPHDVAGLMDALGGKAAFEKRLDDLFTAPEQTKGRTQVDITGMIGQYAHGNEPSHHVAGLYRCLGRTDKYQARVDQIMESLYSSRPDGLCGNDDCGQMSAWYILSMLGRYPLCPGMSEDISLIPAFAGSVEPTSMAHTIVVNPAFEMESDIFMDSTFVSVSNIQDGAKAWWRIVPESLSCEPDSLDMVCGLDSLTAVKFFSGEFVEYGGSCLLRRSCTLESYSETADGRRSFTSSCSIHRYHTDMKIQLMSSYSSQYTAGGPEGLIDDVRGKENWRTGSWQGYQDCDFEAVIDLLEPRSFTELGAGFCQDARSWIWMPRYVDFYVSEDGEDYDLLAHVENTVDPQDYTVQIRDFTWKGELPAKDDESPAAVRYIKVSAKNFGTIPEWHPGAGCEGFIFIDEIWVR